MPEPLSHGARTAVDPPIRSTKPDAQRLKELQRAVLQAPLTRDQVRELMGIAERAVRDRSAVREVMDRMAASYRELQGGLNEINRTVQRDS